MGTSIIKCRLNIDSSFEDTFLANLPLIIQKENLKNLEEQDV
jgi:hypothetical protein